MIPVKQITITRAEGPYEKCGKPKTFASFVAATDWMIRECETFPKDGGYDKHDFTVEFEDGETYSGRMDCKHYSCSNNDLDVRYHILSFCEWMGGIARNPWCGQEKYEAQMSQYTEETKQGYVDFINKYLRED